MIDRIRANLAYLQTYKEERELQSHPLKSVLALNQGKKEATNSYFLRDLPVPLRKLMPVITRTEIL